MILHLDLEAHASLADVRGFVAGNHDGSVQMPERKQAYAHIGQIPRRFSYWRLGRPDKGLLQRYPARTTGFSRAQLKRLIARRVQHAQRWGAAARFGGAAGDAGAKACPTAVPRWGGLVAGASWYAGATNLWDTFYSEHLNSLNPFTRARVPEMGRALTTGLTMNW